MKLALILDPLESLKSYKDTSVAIMAEAQGRGHELFVLMQEDVVLKNGRVKGYTHSLRLVGDGDSWYKLGEAAETGLDAFDAVLMRKDPPFDSEYLYSTLLLELAEEQGARVINRPATLRDFNEKLATAKFPQFTPPTLVTRKAQLIQAFLAEHRDIILKPLDAMGGSGVFRLRQDDPNRNVIVETLTQLETRTVMAQRYIPEISQGDKRILLIDGEPVPYALARIPKEGETRGNLAAGGKGVAQPLSPRDREIAATLGPALRERGLFFVGLDVIGDWLTEINVTSPTGMVEIAAQTDCRPAALFMDALERRCA